jgi:glutaminase
MPFDLDLDEVLRDVAEAARPAAAAGEVPDYIAGLSRVEPGTFGMAVVELDGTEHVLGDVDQLLAIQSISKMFALVLALREVDSEDGVHEKIWQRVGVEPSGDPFNSLVQLEYEKGKPRNPMINAGALVIDDVLLEHCEDPSATLLELMGRLAGEEVAYDEAILDRERHEGGNLNRSMSYLLSSQGNLNAEVADVMEVYVHQCSMAMTVRQLARATRFLANDGIEPASGERILSDLHARRVTALMLTCGTYDAAGQFAFEVGIPCKSGVSGAIIGVIPDRAAVCVWSPPLDESGNSAAGRIALHELAERLDLSIF